MPKLRNALFAFIGGADALCTTNATKTFVGATKASPGSVLPCASFAGWTLR